MPGELSIVGGIAANRPILAVSLLAAGLTALSVLGVRHAEPGSAALIIEYIFNAVYIVALPMGLAALRPQRLVWRVLFFVLIAIVSAALVIADMQSYSLAGVVAAPPAGLTFAALGFTAFLFALSPMASNVARLAAAGPFAAVLGVAGAAGYLALEGIWGRQEGAAAAAIALVLGAGAGVAVSADYAKFFSAGATHRRAAIAASHASIASAAFSLLAVAALFGVQTFKANFGAVEWRVLWAGVAAPAAAMIAALFAVTGSIALASLGEQAAVDENRRRQWFAAAWRPVRSLLPPTSAAAATAIAGVVVVIAFFEAGFSAPVTLAAFFGLIWAAAGAAFVSIRASFLIAGLLAVSAVLAGYLYAALGLEIPALAERLDALTLCAVALGHMMVSWRDAGEVWRNARDITENALSDGLCRFVFLVGAGAAALFVSAVTFDWAGGIGALVYYVTVSFFSLLLAPAMMTAMSARFQRY